MDNINDVLTAPLPILMIVVGIFILVISSTDNIPIPGTQAQVLAEMRKPLQFLGIALAVLGLILSLYANITPSVDVGGDSKAAVDSNIPEELSDDPDSNPDIEQNRDCEALYVSSNELERFSRGGRAFFPVSSRDLEPGNKAFISCEYPKAASLFADAWKENKRNPEPLIYYNNALARQKGEFFSIAVIIPATENQNIAQEILRGVAQAQNSHNSDSERWSLEVLIASDDNDTELSELVAEQIASDETIMAVVGHDTSDATQAALKIYQSQQVPLLTATSTDIELVSSYFFRAVPNDSQLAESLANYAEHKKIGRISIVYHSESNYSTGLANAFKDKIDGNTQIKEYDLDDSSNDFKALARDTYITDDGVLLVPQGDSERDLLGLIDFVEEIDESRRQATSAEKKDIVIMGSDTLYNDSIRQQEAFEGTVLAVPWFREGRREKAFSEKAQELWGAKVSWVTAMSFDATQAIIQAIENSSSRRDLLSRLRNVELREEETSGYPMSFDIKQQREGLKPVLVEISKGGRIDEIPLREYED